MHRIIVLVFFLLGVSSRPALASGVLKFFCGYDMLDFQIRNLVMRRGRRSIRLVEVMILPQGLQVNFQLGEGPGLEIFNSGLLFFEKL
jgi:hypothetical protein